VGTAVKGRVCCSGGGSLMSTAVTGLLIIDVAGCAAAVAVGTGVDGCLTSVMTVSLSAVADGGGLTALGPGGSDS
jgi:hypothetical protein